MEMNQELAKRLFFEGATFVFLNVPKGTEFGIDMKVWNTDENFRGIKMIPPGLHFVHFSAVSKTGEQAPRSGFFYNFKKGELVAKMYDRQKEDVSDTPVTEEEVLRLSENIMNLDKFLGPYPYDIKDKWESLINHISNNLVQDLAPKSGFIRSALILMSCKDSDRPRGTLDLNSPSTSQSNVEIPSPVNTKRRRRYSNREKDDDLLPDLKPVAGTELQFTKFPELNYPEGSTAADITKHSLDSTFVLDSMLIRHKSITDFIGELQFSFVCFLVGHSLEAFEHWKNLVGLICSCDLAITKHRSLYDMFVPVLEEQLKEIPEEFLADIVSNINFVYCKLRILFRTVQDSNVDGRLKTKYLRFKDSLTDKYFWDFSNLEEDEDEAPVVVQLDD